MDREKLEACLPDICGSMRQLFAWTVWWDQYREDFDNGEHLPPQLEHLSVIKLACYEATLFNARKLSEFFSGSHQRPDDIRASYFSDYPIKAVLQKETIAEINKRLAHQTTLPAEYDVVFFLGRVQRILGLECIGFLQHITSTFSPVSDDVQEQVECTKLFLRQIVKRVEEIDNENPV